MVLEAVHLALISDCPGKRMRKGSRTGTWCMDRSQAGITPVKVAKRISCCEHEKLTSFDDSAACFDVEIAGDESDVGEVKDLRSVRKCLCPARGKRLFPSATRNRGHCVPACGQGDPPTSQNRRTSWN